MRNIFIVLLTLICVITLDSCSKGVKLQGDIKGAANQKITLELMGIDSTYVIDSTRIGDDGLFELNAPVASEPTFYRASLPSGKTITFIADSIDQVSVHADATVADWNSTISFDNSDENTLLLKTISEASALQSKLQAFAQNSSTLAEQEQEAKSNELQTAINDYKNNVKEVIFNNPRSFASYYALYQNIMDMPVFDITNPNDHVLFATVATSLNIAEPNSKRVQNLCDYVLQARAVRMRQQLIQEQLDNAVVTNSPDIKMNDINGETRKLSDYRGKTVLLQFWISTDKSSRNSNKQLAKLYAMYKAKGLEIFSVSLDTSKVLWEDASKNDNITWVNVCDLLGLSSKYVATYNIRATQGADGNLVVAIPQNFILDKDGQIVGKNLFGTRLDERMAELFK